MMNIFDISNTDIGLWEFYKDESICREVWSNTMEVDIAELIKGVNEIVELHVGKLPNIEKLSKELHLSIKNLYMSERTTKEIYEKVKDESGVTNIMFFMEKRENTALCFCNIFGCLEDCKSYVINIRLTISRPMNAVAQLKCNQLMNYKIDRRMVSKLASGSPNKLA
jgi:hypothetical protein